VLTSYPKRPTRTQGAPSIKEIEKVMAKKTLYRAKDALGVESKKDGLGNTWRYRTYFP
jgi:hypothetical protein